MFILSQSDLAPHTLPTAVLASIVAKTALCATCKLGAILERRHHYLYVILYEAYFFEIL